MALRFIAALLFLFMSLTLAEAKRVALVIGNNNYVNLPPEKQLKKALNDAAAIRKTLTDDLGFTVLYGENTDWASMNSLIKQLETGVAEGDVVFLYFSGHGVSIGGENFLLPSDIPTPRQGQEARLIGNSFGAEALTRRIQKRGAKAIFSILDACRDNPFVDEGGKSIGGNGGLKSIVAAEGVFTLYAAGLGQTALDRLSEDDPDPNSVFTRNLIPLLKTGGLSQVDLAKKIQHQVAALAAKIGHTQEPAYYDQILGFVTLNDSKTPPLVIDPPKADSIAVEFQVARSLNSKAGWDAFLGRHGNADDLLVDVAKRERDKLVLLDVPTKKAEPIQGVNVVTQCDLLASPETDESRGITRVELTAKKVDAAVAACRKALTDFPSESRFMGQLGRALLKGKNYDEAAIWIRRAADAGNSHAIANLGWMYMQGWGLKQDRVEALKWMRKAAESEIEYGMVGLGLLYELGTGVPQDFAEAVKWYRKAADKGDVAAIVILGELYENGKIVDRDYSEAVQLYRKGAEAGSTYGMLGLARMLRNGTGVEMNISEADAWEQRAKDAAAQ